MGVIIIFMKRIATQKNGIGKRILINIPFILLIALMTACFGGGLLLVFYSIVSVIAFNSAMIYMIVAGAGAILIGIGLCLIAVYKKYYAFYNKKMGWKYEKEEKPVEKTVTYANKPASERIKKLLTVSNVGIAILALGSVFAIISASLGSIDRANWVNAIGGFKEQRGYYTDVRNEPVSYPIAGMTSAQKPINLITITQPTSGERKKEIVVVYSKLADRQGRIEIKGYKKFEGDFSVSRKTNGNNDTVTVNVGNAPALTSPLDKLLFFVFDDYIVEKQIYIYIPCSEKDNIAVDEADRILYEKSDGTIDNKTMIIG